MRNNMNNKGFTLVELLAVMVILVSISFVAVGSITSSLTRRGDKEMEEQEELAIGAAKIYFSLNDTSCVKIQTLIDGDYFSDNKKVDKLNVNYTIKLINGNYKYSNASC